MSELLYLVVCAITFSVDEAPEVERVSLDIALVNIGKQVGTRSPTDYEDQLCSGGESESDWQWKEEGQQAVRGCKRSRA